MILDNAQNANTKKQNQLGFLYTRAIPIEVKNGYMVLKGVTDAKVNALRELLHQVMQSRCSRDAAEMRSRSTRDRLARAPPPGDPANL